MPQPSPSFTDVLAATQTEAKIKRAPLRWLTFDNVFISFTCSFSIGFLVFAYCVSLIDPDYFNKRVLATMAPAGLDTVRTGTVAGPAALIGAAMPGPRIVRTREPVAADYQIVTVFDREAILATKDELLRIKVGSVAPGLGEILSIEESDGTLVVGAKEATLRSAPN